MIKHNKTAKTTKVMMGLLAGAMTLQLTGCGDLKALITSPEVRAQVQSFLDLYLGREVDGEAQTVKPGDIRAIRADGKPVNFEVGAEGKVSFKDLPPDAQELEVDYNQADEPVVMPIQPEQKQDGRLVMRGVTRMEKVPGGALKVDAHFGGFDFDRNGEFDEQRPQFVHQDRFLSVHDVQKGEVRRFEAPGQGQAHFDFKAPPKQVIQGQGFFLPPRPLMIRLAGARPDCGALHPKPDGSIDLPRPDGSPRNLKSGEFELRPEARAVKINKPGEPDTGKIVVMPCGPRPIMPGMPPHQGLQDPNAPRDPNAPQPPAGSPMPPAGSPMPPAGEPTPPVMIETTVGL